MAFNKVNGREWSYVSETQRVKNHRRKKSEEELYSREHDFDNEQDDEFSDFGSLLDAAERMLR